MKMLLLLCCWIIAGITAEDPPMKHYRMKNSLLCLNIGKSPPYNQLTWLFNDTAVFVNHEVRSNYTDKMDYYPSNFSLCINKVTETDSGIYKVTFLDSAYKAFVETHRLFVEGYKKPVPPEDTIAPPIPIVVVIVCVCVVFVVFIACVAKRCFSTENNHHQEQTSSLQLIQSQPVEAQPQPLPIASTSSSSQAEVSYENPNQTSSPAIRPRQELSSKQSETVDTVYSVLQLPNRTTSPDGRKDTEGHKSIGEASTSQPVTLYAEQPMQIDTVYNVLQKPKNLKSQHHQ
ncbi:hypothetical protein L3Q82_018043 [Scortum barcoo]|uniref:Uncharacterized protein n=1 Tax=Scortum barcoo TaxID=214431 RepID=A0ACB8VHT7_9TELE|nr:hypothetical protein L3Q82_018043 [Scortum barcoo]